MGLRAGQEASVHHINIRILHLGSKAQDKWDSRNHFRRILCLRDLLGFAFWPSLRRVHEASAGT